MNKLIQKTWKLKSLKRKNADSDVRMSEKPYTSVFITTNLNLESGGGIVSLHEEKALETVTYVERVITDSDINCKLPKLPNTARAFLWDYLTANELKNYKVNIAFFNGSPFGITTRLLKPAKIIVDVPAHNAEISIEEFEKLGISYPFMHMKDPFLWSVYSQHIKNADVTLCPSRMSAKYITKKLSLKNKVIVIPHGCFLPEETNTEHPNFNITHVGTNSPDKGQIYLVQAWRQLRQRIELSGNLFMVGRGTSIWTSFGAFCFAHVPNIGKVYKKCSVYVQPSVTEGFGLPVLEAMAYARPVIVTKGAGASELVEDGKDGFVVPIRNAGAIKEKLQYFYDNPSEIERMGKNARKKAEKHSWKIIETKYQKLIQEVLNEHS